MPADRFESYLPDMALLIGQSDMPKARLDRASKLRAIIDVENNFLQNIDYDVCFERGARSAGNALSSPVRPWRYNSDAELHEAQPAVRSANAI
jgi:hypothetical protein